MGSEYTIRELDRGRSQREAEGYHDPAFEAVWDIAKRQNATLRTGAYLIAVKRVVEAKAARAIWP